MPFSFTFKLSVPGLSNPFSSTALSAPVPPTPSTSSDSIDRRQKISRRRPSPVFDSPSKARASRKRGWEPTFAEPSQSSATYTSTGGYLDTPAKYRDMADELNLHDMEMIASDTEMPPPAKRRRGLAGSIVSTALSAALIGTAVGLTVYRLWRDRGKEPEQLSPPPPYQQGEWTPTPEPAPLQITPATPRSRKSRYPVASTSKRTIAHRRTVRPRPHLHQTPPRATSPPTSVFPNPQPEFDFGHDPMDTDTSIVETQMDWIGDKLSMLIEEGKKALNREIVIMCDAKEDEVDDGSGAWEEEHPHPTGSLSRASSMKRSTKRPRSLAPPHHSSPHLPLPHTPSPSPKKHGFDVPASISYASSHTRGMSVESGLNMTPSTSFREDERAWESPEIRESMERARARLLRNRGS
ncbi:hypothetical protein Hypma_003571 [Hypsizygus marmoreus]|uniref:Uncharacterized protein n=1 Tax=Hypsizygus marmoreus TaxID=39966 RepID=A0A369JAU1_HYPMA|nr:hypothetical protein Hypma_003571 [Hypsizygus marmoreus]